MSEGDSIHRLARCMDAALGGRKIESAAAPSPRSPLHPRASRLEGRVLERAEARGKHLLIAFEGGLVLRSHLKMNGAWQLCRPGEKWRKSPRRAWIALRGEGCEAVQFDGPELELSTRGRLALHHRLRALGPDLLGEQWSVERGLRALRAGDQTRTLGESLLDQRLVAGIGNIYKSEGCFEAKIDPWRRLRDIDDAELALVLEATAEQLRAGVERGRQPQRIYRLAGRPCPRCGGPIRSRGQGDDNRTTYWCPSCQR